MSIIHHVFCSNDSNKKRYRKGIRIGTFVLAAVLAAPSLVHAQGAARVVKKIHHIHIGDAQTGGGCYTKEVFHVHKGNPGKGGSCYNLPIYHEHTGNEQEGGGCYGEQVCHVHEGSETEGGACFGQPVYHVHEGTEEEGGSCYQTKIYHQHGGNSEEGGSCYQTPVCHEHTGSASAGGGCYGKEVCHQHSGSASAGGGCYQKKIMHQHSGSAVTGGGCFGKPVFHKHSGSMQTGGPCFRNPVYHKHTGNETVGGGCYTVPVCHVHTGTETEGGGCYAPVYHQHTDACYQEEECTVEYTGGLEINREADEYCAHHGNTQVVYFTADYRHRDCGAGAARESSKCCWICKNMNKAHKYRKLVCGKNESTPEGYVLSCGKDTDTVEGWKLGCGRSEEDIAGYLQSCGKTEQTIDSYERNCGKTEGTVDGYGLSCGKTEKTVEAYERNCGKTEKTVEGYKLSCTKNKDTVDGYGLSCEKTEETIDGYELNCGKTEETIEFYRRNCGKGNTDIEAYALSCSKTEKTIDGYELNCGKNGGAVCAEFAVVNTNTAWTSEAVTLLASCQDPEGFLQLAEQPFLWEGADSVAGKGILDSLSVTENGSYHVRLLVENQDIDATEEDLTLSIEVKNIDKTAPVINKVERNTEEKAESVWLSVAAEDLQPDGSSGSGLHEQAYSFDGGITWNAANELEVRENGEVSVAVRDNCGNRTEQIITVDNIREDDGSGDDDPKDDDKPTDDDPGDGDEPGDDDPEDGEEPEDDDPEDGDKPKDDDPGDGDEPNDDDPEDDDPGDSGDPKDDSSKENTPDGDKEKKTLVLPIEKKETEEVTAEQIMAEPMTDIDRKTVKKQFILEPVVKAVTFTMGSVILTASVLWLIYLMYRGIKVYHSDGEGGYRYAGSCLMQKIPEGYEVVLPEMITDRSATGQYLLRPGRLFAERHKGKELLVIAGEERKSVWIDSEIPLHLSPFV